MKTDSSSPDGNGRGTVASRRVPDSLALLILCALIALALNLRSPLTAVPPVIGQIRADLGINSTVAGLLTSIPVLCFGLLTPLASLLIARTGIQTAIFVTLGGAAVGLGLRPYGGLPGMLGGTLLIGASLVIGNIVSLMVIARDFSQRMSVVTGIYTAGLNVGTMFTAALTAPLATVIGWRLALASWMWLALLAMVLWWWVSLRTPPVAPQQGSAHSSAARPSGRTPIWRRPIVWLLSMAFAVHLFVYYAITAWLPAYLIEVDGMSATRAGLVASAFQILSFIGSFGVPLTAKRFSLGRQLLIMGGLWAVTPLGMLWFPSMWPAWSISGGIAQGGTFVLVFMLIMRHAFDLNDNRRLSTVVQGVGYSLASLGPLVVGSFRELQGHWSGAYYALSALSLVLIAAGIAVERLPPPPK